MSASQVTNVATVIIFKDLEIEDPNELRIKLIIRELRSSPRNSQSSKSLEPISFYWTSVCSSC